MQFDQLKRHEFIAACWAEHQSRLGRN